MNGAILNERSQPLDWLRGLMALSIMFYHYGSWHDASHPIGRLGIYGVSIFFILSGLSMAIAYDQYLRDVRTSANFFIRRLFRIWPLLWFAVALVVVPTSIFGKGPFGHEPYGLFQVLLNITTLAGFDEKYGYINVGAWSIGNEMVYYVLTPLLIAAYHWKRFVGNFLTAISALISCYFAFHLLNPEYSLAMQFATYANPLNNFFLYCAGLAIFYNLHNIKIYFKWRLPVMLLVLIIFFIYPASGDQINIVTGHNRIALVFISIAIVIVFYKFAPSLPRGLSLILVGLGVATYGIYLLHPIVAWYVDSGLSQIEKTFEIQRIKYIRTLLSIILSIVSAFLAHKYLETPFVAIGKRLTSVR